MDQQVLSEINRLEGRVWIWSIIYYRFGDSVVDDEDYNNTSKLLQSLSIEHPKEFENSIHYNVFKDFSWISGYDLPLYDPNMTSIAEFVLHVHKYGYESYKEYMRERRR